MKCPRISDVVYPVCLVLLSSPLEKSKPNCLDRSALTYREEYHRMCSTNDWEIREHLAAYHYRRCLNDVGRKWTVFPLLSRATHYSLCVTYWWTSSVVTHRFVSCRWWSCERDRRDMWEDSLFCSSETNDTSRHDRERACRSTELAAPNYSSKCSRTKVKNNKACFTSRRPSHPYVDKTKVMFTGLRLRSGLSARIRRNSMALNGRVVPFPLASSSLTILKQNID